MDTCLDVEFSLQNDWPAPTATNLTLPTVNDWQTWMETWLRDLQSAGEQLLQDVTACELCLRLVSDGQMQHLNAQYRQQDKPTDVLAFAVLESDFPDWSEGSEAESRYLGDIVIAVPTAQRQAEQQGDSLRHELAWLAAHAVLHLLGWDHPDESQLRMMLQRQAELLAACGLRSPPYN